MYRILVKDVIKTKPTLQDCTRSNFNRGLYNLVNYCSILQV